jgi:hypothetical protein
LRFANIQRDVPPIGLFSPAALPKCINLEARRGQEAPQSSEMIDLHSPFEIEPDPHGGWQLVYWSGDTFDYTTPFRALLGDIAEALGQDRQNDLQLPQYEIGEDFVEGMLRLGSTVLRIYYEHSLGYLALMSDSEATLRDVADRIQRSARIA